MTVHAKATLVVKGIGASPGVVVGRAFLVDPRRLRTPKAKIDEEAVVHELERLEGALARSDQQLEELKAKVAQDGHDHELIIEAHRLMLHDPMLIDEVRKLISEDQINAEWAVRRVTRKIKHLFDNIIDEYFRERRQDIDYVADRIIRNLMGEAVDEELHVPDGSIVVAHDLSPAETALLVKSGKVLGFVTDLGGQTSHTAIVARARETPAVVGAGRASEQILSGDLLALDGSGGQVLVNPTADQLALFRETMRRHLETGEKGLKTKDLPAVSVDRYRIRLLGNMEFVEEIPSLQAHGAEGIGLFRTEFLFLGRDTLPSEEEHYRCYRQVLEAFQGAPVTIRTFDLGGDKVPSGRKHERELNPAMGLRAIRFSLAHRDLFRVQLRALLRASVHGNLKLLFPLISGVSELREARSELEHCRSELGKAGVPVGRRIPIGIMVETPSAAWTADRLAMEADFFSVGTNDLIQYSMAIDRQNKDVAYLYRPMHLSILRSLQSIVHAAKAAQISVSMCGEMAGDPVYSLVLLALGFDELSMTAGQLPAVKQIIRRSSRAEAMLLLEQAMALSTAEEIERFIRTEVDRRFAGEA